jgi:hypothetical protein
MSARERNRFKGKSAINGEFYEGSFVNTGMYNYIVSDIGSVPVHPFSIRQYVTKNKNSEIWEGDYDENGNMVYWCDVCMGWQFALIDIPTKDIITCHNCEGNFMWHDHAEDFLPIGNIYNTYNELKL